MTKKIQILAWCFGLWIGAVSHQLAFAVAPHTDLVQQNDFWAKNERSILHMGIKSWVKGIKRVIEQHWALGSEIAIGSVVEWKPLNGIGFQTGVFYSYNSCFTLNFIHNTCPLLDKSIRSFKHRVVDIIQGLDAQDSGYILNVSLVTKAFHAISIPLFFRLYPEKSRQLVCYGGPRLIWICSDLSKQQYMPVCIDSKAISGIIDAILFNRYLGYLQERLHTKVEDLQQEMTDLKDEAVSKICHSVLKTDHNIYTNLPMHRFSHWDLVWDFGVEIRANSGVLIGVNGLGVVLGYDFVK